MLTDRIISVGGSIFALLSFTRLRDHLVINQKLADKILDATVEGTTVTLVGRVVEHQPATFNLKLPGRHVRIVATEYHANGGTVDVSPTPGASGSNGANGNSGYASHNPIMNRDGSPGAKGGLGGPGRAAPTIQLVCERLRDAHLIANGGAGGPGGAGGAGGKGGAGVAPGPKVDALEGTNGGAGGAAGAGGAGGKGGEVHVSYVSADNAQAIGLAAHGGAGGTAGARGQGGKGGRDAHPGSTGTASHPGAVGAAGRTVSAPVSADDYWSRVTTLLGSQVAEWAAYRLKAGEYFYRVFKPSDPEPADQPNLLHVAMQEFEAVLRLQPANVGATRFRNQILNNQNVLGLSRDLDIIPDFNRYNLQYAAWANSVSEAYGRNLGLMVGSNNLAAIIAQFGVYVDDIGKRIPVDAADRDAAVIATQATQLEQDSVTGLLNGINAEIAAAKEEMSHHTINIGALVATVAEVAGAVASVVAAVPTGGASLVALVPDLAVLFTTVSTEGGAIFNELFGPSGKELNDLKAAYKRVGKDVEDVYKGIKSTISMVGSVQKLLSGSMADNGKLVGLLAKAIQLSHELALAKLHAIQADLTLTARETQYGNDQALLVTAKRQLASLSLDEEVLKNAGHTGFLNTHGYADLLAATAFRAERSVEIYTLKGETAHVSYDNGYVNPDVEQDYAEAEISLADLIARYNASLDASLDPLSLQTDFEDYFAGDAQFDFAPGTVFRSFTDEGILAAFKATRSLSFSINLPYPPANPPAEEFEVKIEDVHVALIGAGRTKRLRDLPGGARGPVLPGDARTGEGAHAAGASSDAKGGPLHAFASDGCSTHVRGRHAGGT